MTETIFIRLLAEDDKVTALNNAVQSLHDSSTTQPTVYTVNPQFFSQVPGSPFAYWVSDKIRKLFVKLPPFESEERTVKQGLATADDFRFVRLWWEVSPDKIVTGNSETTPDEFRQQTFEDKRWVAFAKGGEYSPYYADLHLVVNWERDGEEMKEWAGSLYNNSHWSRIIKNVDFYFKVGLTFPRRTKRFCPKVLPKGVIFGHGGQTAFAPKYIESILAILGAQLSQFNVSLFLGNSPQDQGGTNPQFEAGIIKKIPIIQESTLALNDLKKNIEKLIIIKRNFDLFDEISHNFYIGYIFLKIQKTEYSLNQVLATYQTESNGTNKVILEHQKQIDDIVYELYGISQEDRKAIESNIQTVTYNEEDNSEEDDKETTLEINSEQHTSDLISYTLGCIYGRWDICYATGEKQPPELPDPFAPLPACSPGMLTGEDGLPLTATPDNHPLQIDWDGILVDDPDHPDDIIRRIQDVLEVIWGDKAEAIEQEACEILGVKTLRDYFRKSANGGFWMDHVKRYSKSRRKAPIYWLLQSSKRNYALWIYYHRLDKDILYKALVNYVEPKLRLEESNLEHLRTQKTAAGDTGKQAKQLEKQIDRQEAFISELNDFADKLRRAANLNLAPDLNDGVVLNIAPLWELVPWSEAKTYWQELTQGKYEWSSIGKQLREKGVI